jgi:hypothetical protein
MSIRARLTLVLLLLGAVTVVVYAAAVGVFSGAATDDADRRALRTAAGAADLERALARQHNGRVLMLAGDAEGGAAEVAAGEEEFRIALDVLREVLPGDSAPEALADLGSAYERYRERAAGLQPPHSGRLFGLSGGTRFPTDDLIRVDRHRAEVVEAAERIVAAAEQEADAARDEATRGRWRRTAWVTAVALLGLILAILAGRRLYRSIARPLADLSDGLAAIGRGDAARRVTIQGRDELSVIAAAVNATADRLAAVQAASEGGLREGRRFVETVLDALAPDLVVVDRRGETLAAGAAVRGRLGPDPIGALRRAGRLAEDALRDHLDRLAGDAGTRPAVVRTEQFEIRPLVGPAGGLLGALVRFGMPTAAPPVPAPPAGSPAVPQH